MLKTSLTECLEMCLVDAIVLRDNPASRSSMMSFTLIFLAILLAQKEQELAGVLISDQHGLKCGSYNMG